MMFLAGDKLILIEFSIEHSPMLIMDWRGEACLKQGLRAIWPLLPEEHLLLTGSVRDPICCPPRELEKKAEALLWACC